MVCKMVFGNSFQGCIDYITGRYDKDKQTKLLAHSQGVPAMDNETVARLFEVYARKGGHDIKGYVGHFAYSFHPDDAHRLTDGLMAHIIQEHMDMMGIVDTEWIIGRHYDTAHDHAHLMFSMVDRNGKVISDSLIHARNKRICKYLTEKYGLHGANGKTLGNRDRLHGKDSMKYDFYDRIMRCLGRSATWEEFDRALKADGLKLRFHYNNVSGKLMGVTFTDGRVSFSGRQLDQNLRLGSLVELFGDLKEITHDNVREWYEYYSMRLRNCNDWDGYKRLMKAYPEWDTVFPDGKVPEFGYPSILGLLSQQDSESRERLLSEHTPSEDGESAFIGLDLMCAVLLQPYQPQLSMGGGGGGNDRGWRDLKDEDKDKYRFRFKFNRSGGRGSHYTRR